MKKFIIEIFLSALALLIVLIVADRIVSKRLVSQNPTFYEDWNCLFEGEINSELLILGSSRAVMCYSPQVLDSILGIRSYNLGIHASAVNHDIARYNIYRDYNPKPKVIVHNIDLQKPFSKPSDFMINQSKLMTFNPDKKMLMPYYFNKSFRKHMLPEIESTWAERNIPFYRYYLYGVPNLFKVKHEEKNKYKGFVPSNTELDVKSLENIVCIKVEHDPQLMEDFTKYLEQTYREGIKVVLVYAPIYIDISSKIEDLNNVYTTIDSLSKAYHPLILDYTYSSFSYDSSLFTDGIHLNEKGAIAFSTQLAYDLDSIQVINPRKEMKTDNFHE